MVRLPFLRRRKKVKDILTDISAESSKVRNKQLNMLRRLQKIFILLTVVVFSLWCLFTLYILYIFPYDRMPPELSESNVIVILCLVSFGAYFLVFYLTAFQMFLPSRKLVTRYYDRKSMALSSQISDTITQLKESSNFYETLELIKEFSPDEFEDLPRSVRNIITASQRPPTPRDVEPVPIPDDTPRVQHSAAAKKSLPQALVDYAISLLVSDAPENRMALICGYCHSHNGLVSSDEYSSRALTYQCPRCHALNTFQDRRRIAGRRSTSNSNESDGRNSTFSLDMADIEVDRADEEVSSIMSEIGSSAEGETGLSVSRWTDDEARGGRLT